MATAEMKSLLSNVQNSCSVVYKNGVSKNGVRLTPGDSGRVRLGLMIKLLEALDSPGGKDEAVKLVNSEDKKGRFYDISHYLHARTGRTMHRKTPFRSGSKLTMSVAAPIKTEMQYAIVLVMASRLAGSMKLLGRKYTTMSGNMLDGRG